MIIFFKFTLRCQQSDCVPFICHRSHLATGVIDTGPGGKFVASVVVTGGKFAAGINNTSGIVANLPPVSLIPVVHLDLQISPQIFEKI